MSHAAANRATRKPCCRARHPRSAGNAVLHEGQLTGARIKMPVQLGRRPIELVQAEVKTAHENFWRL